jgi:CHAT domain-containing protein
MLVSASGRVLLCTAFLVYFGASDHATDQAGTTGNPPEELLEQASQLGAQRKYSDAIALAERAIVIYRETAPTSASLADAYGFLGQLAFQAQDFKRAAAALEQQVAMVGRATGEQDVAYGRALSDLANATRGLGQLAEAKALFERAITIHRRAVPVDEFAFAQTAISFGNLLDVLGDRTGAESLLSETVSNYERRAESELDAQGLTTKAIALNNLGLLDLRASDFDRAEQSFNRSKALREKVSRNPSIDPAVALVTSNLALVHQERGQFDLAEPLYQRALEIYGAMANPPQTTIASTINNLAMIHMLRGRSDEAAGEYERALEIRKSRLGERHPDVAKTLESLAVFEQVQGHSDAASRAMDQSTGIYEENLRTVLMSGSDQQRQAYMTTVQENTDIALSMRAAVLAQNTNASTWAATLVMRRKGRVLDAAATMTERLASRMTPDERQLFDKLSAARAQLAALVLQSTDAPAGQRDAARRKLETDIDALESSLAARSREFAAELRPIDVTAVREQLPVGTVLVEYVRYRPFNPTAIGRNNRFGDPKYAAFVMSRSAAPRWFELGPAEPIERRIRGFRDMLRAPSSPARNQSRGIELAAVSGVRTAGRDLGRLLLDPIQADLAGADRILFAPDGELSVIPFAALQIARRAQPAAPAPAAGASEFLIERVEIDYLTSGRDLLSRPERTATSEPSLIVAAPRFDAGPTTEDNATFRPLAGTAEEAEALRGLIPNARVLSGPAATEHAIKIAKGPRVLHVATHGFFLDAASPPSAEATGSSGRGGLALVAVEPQSLGRQALLRSGLALAGANQRQGGDGEDGLLTALEAASLDLHGTQLVVLSACDTGLGEVRSGDGVYGLRRALTIAGAESQVMSLWQVSDRATRDLMIAFYKQLAGGAGRAAAMRNVQLDLLKSKQWSHPYYWAAFVVAGAWEPLRP